MKLVQMTTANWLFLQQTFLCRGFYMISFLFFARFFIFTPLSSRPAPPTTAPNNNPLSRKLIFDQTWNNAKFTTKAKFFKGKNHFLIFIVALNFAFWLLSSTHFAHLFSSCAKCLKNRIINGFRAACGKEEKKN